MALNLGNNLGKPLSLAIAVILPVQFGGISAAMADNFGAIARSRSSGDKGYAWNFSTRAQAERRARQECSKISGADDCRALLWFKNACGSIAEASNGGAGTGWGTDEELAERYAIQSCRTVGSGCEVVKTFCTE
jgi:serine/threonine-protein kinase